MSKTSVHPTVFFSCSRLSVFKYSRQDCSSPKKRQWSDLSFCKKTFCSTNCCTQPETAAGVESNIPSPYCQSSTISEILSSQEQPHKGSKNWNSESSHKPVSFVWSSKCLLQALWGATTGQEKEWQEKLTRNPFQTLYGSDPSNQKIISFIILLILQPGVCPYSQRQQ